MNDEKSNLTNECKVPKEIEVTHPAILNYIIENEQEIKNEKEELEWLSDKLTDEFKVRIPNEIILKYLHHLTFKVTFDKFSKPLNRKDTSIIKKFRSFIYQYIKTLDKTPQEIIDEYNKIWKTSWKNLKPLEVPKHDYKKIPDYNKSGYWKVIGIRNAAIVSASSAEDAENKAQGHVQDFGGLSLEYIGTELPSILIIN